MHGDGDRARRGEPGTRPDVQVARSGHDVDVFRPAQQGRQRRHVLLEQAELESAVSRELLRPVLSRLHLLLVGRERRAQARLEPRVDTTRLARSGHRGEPPEGDRQRDQRQQDEVRDELGFEATHGPGDVQSCRYLVRRDVDRWAVDNEGYRASGCTDPARRRRRGGRGLPTAARSFRAGRPARHRRGPRRRSRGRRGSCAGSARPRSCAGPAAAGPAPARAEPRRRAAAGRRRAARADRTRSAAAGHGQRDGSAGDRAAGDDLAREGRAERRPARHAPAANSERPRARERHLRRVHDRRAQASEGSQAPARFPPSLGRRAPAVPTTEACRGPEVRPSYEVGSSGEGCSGPEAGEAGQCRQAIPPCCTQAGTPCETGPSGQACPPGQACPTGQVGATRPAARAASAGCARPQAAEADEADEGEFRKAGQEPTAHRATRVEPARSTDTACGPRQLRQLRQLRVPRQWEPARRQERTLEA